jgi:hypothetical protein
MGAVGAELPAGSPWLRSSNQEDALSICTSNPASFWCMSLADMWQWLISVPVLGFVALLVLIGYTLYMTVGFCVFIFSWRHPFD